MKFWSSYAHIKAFDDLVAQSIGRNIVRLQCQKNATQALGLEMSPATCRIVWRWWLGEMLYGASAEAVVCPGCADSAMVVRTALVITFCAVPRHEAIVSQLTHFLQAFLQASPSAWAAETAPRTFS